MIKLANIKSYFLKLALVFTTLSGAFTSNSYADRDGLIPRHLFFGAPDQKKQTLRISPDGKQLSYIAPLNGVLNIWIAPVSDISKARAVTNDTGRGIMNYAWAYNGKDILYIQDSDGDENWRLYALDLSAQKSRLLTPAKSVQARFVKISPKLPQEIVIGINERNPQNHDLYRVNLQTGAMELIYENDDGFGDILCSEDLNVVFAIKTIDDGSGELWQYQNGKFVPFRKIAYEDYLTSIVVGISAEHLYIKDSKNSDFQELLAIKLADIKSKGAKAPAKVIFKDSKADVSEVLMSEATSQVLAASGTYFKQKWEVIDLGVSKAFKNLTSKLEGNISIVSQSLDDKHWIVAAGNDTQPLSYYYYNLENDELKLVFCISSELEKYEDSFAKMHPVKLRARDGLTLPSYVTLPKDVDKDGAPSRPVPFVMLVHGGPHVRDHWGFNNLVQWLANRGYGVLQMNYRISTGFGKELIARGEWGGKEPIEDLIDGANWLVKNKFSTKEQIAIMGGSYGGYATLASLAFYPDVFKCGVDIVGPSNLETLLASIPLYWTNFLPTLLKMMKADPRTEEGRAYLRSKSPLFFADQIKSPLLVLQGANDPRVKQQESDQIVAEMNKNKIPVAYGLFPNEGHGFARPENSIAAFAVIEEFLAQHLGGRYEKAGDDLKKSSLIMKQDSLTAKQ